MTGIINLVSLLLTFIFAGGGMKVSGKTRLMGKKETFGRDSIETKKASRSTKNLRLRGMATLPFSFGVEMA